MSDVRTYWKLSAVIVTRKARARKLATHVVKVLEQADTTFEDAQKQAVEEAVKAFKAKDCDAHIRRITIDKITEKKEPGWTSVQW